MSWPHGGFRGIMPLKTVSCKARGPTSACKYGKSDGASRDSFWVECRRRFSQRAEKTRAGTRRERLDVVEIRVRIGLWLALRNSSANAVNKARNSAEETPRLARRKLSFLLDRH